MEKKPILMGLYTRAVVTVVGLAIINHYAHSIPKVGAQIYIILPIFLFIADAIDGAFVKPSQKHFFSTFGYQAGDKIIDVWSYLLVLLLLPSDGMLRFFVFYRLVGVIFFIWTKNAAFLILFFDFVKEYLLYYYFFRNPQPCAFLGFLIFLKIGFEAKRHRKQYPHGGTPPPPFERPEN